MEQNILKEELGISNDVNKIVTQIKSVIGDNYNKNKDNINKYVSPPNFQNSIFYNKIIVNLKNISISIVIYSSIVIFTICIIICTSISRSTLCSF